MNIREAAFAWHNIGCCILAAASDGTKRPGVGAWERYKTMRPTPAQLLAWCVDESTDGIGMICGAVSGNVEMLEFEGRAAELVEEFISALGAYPDLITKLMTYVERTPSGGFHFLYRVDGAVGGNTKLARRQREPTEENPSRFEVLIETRGEGGWTILAPSAGRTHPSGGSWEVIAGSPGVLAILTEGERDIVHATAMSFDQMPIPAPQMPQETRSQASSSEDIPPGSDLDSRASWGEILEPAGWKMIFRRGEVTYWQRPGKRDRSISASTGHQGDWLYVFSTSTEFEAERTYTKFGAYTVLNHNGDHSMAARELAGRGYGSNPEPTRILHLVPPPPTAPGDTAVEGATVRGLATSPSLEVATTLTDDGNAILLVSQIHGALMYSPERKMWLAWDQTKWAWEPDRSKVITAMRETIRAIEPADKREAEWKMRSLLYRQIDSAVKLAASDSTIQVKIENLDSNGYALNTPSGVVDLRTKELTAPIASELHTRITGVPVDLLSRPGKFLAFLEETFSKSPDPAAMIEFIQRLAGYSATGRVTHHVLPFLHGPGQNGKGVLFEILQAILGTYAGAAPSHLLLGKDDLAAQAELSGKRLVVISEVKPNARFDEERAKNLTGGDRIPARFLYANYFTFSPTHHLWLAGNHQPRVPSGGSSFWRRMRLIPFNYVVPEEKKNPELAAELVAEEGPAILGWIIEGARKQFDASGLAAPDEVMAATTAYAEEEDNLGRFIEERCVVGGGRGAKEPTDVVGRAYRQWCERQGLKPMNPTVFGRELKTRFSIGDAKSNGRKLYTNISLKMIGVVIEDDTQPYQAQLN